MDARHGFRGWEEGGWMRAFLAFFGFWFDRDAGRESKPESKPPDSVVKQCCHSYSTKID